MTSADTTRALPEELTIYTVAESYPRFLAWLDAGEDADGDGALSVDAAVGEIDAAGLQLLVSLSRGLADEGRRLQLLSPSAALSTACTSLGLGALLAPAATPEQAG